MPGFLKLTASPCSTKLTSSRRSGDILQAVVQDMASDRSRHAARFIARERSIRIVSASVGTGIRSNP